MRRFGVGYRPVSLHPCRRATGSRRSAARRTRSTPTSSSARCSPTAWSPAARPDDADLVVVNTCAFIEEARQESIDTVLALTDARGRAPGWSSPAAWPSATATSWPRRCPRSTLVAGLRRAGHAVGRRRPQVRDRQRGARLRPAEPAPPRGRRRPWAYVKVAEGCDRACGFCAIPSFRGRSAPARSTSILDEVEQLEAPGDRARRPGPGRLRTRPGRGRARRHRAAGARRSPSGSTRVRLLYLYPSELTDALIDTICATGVPYFDLSLQHVSQPLLRRMRRWGDGDRFLGRSRHPRARARRRVPVQLHRRLPGRDRGRPRPAAALRRGRRARLVRVLRLLAGGRHLRGRARRAGRRRPGGRAPARAHRAAGRASPRAA